MNAGVLARTDMAMYIHPDMTNSNARTRRGACSRLGFTDAADLGFFPGADGTANTIALQKAVGCGGAVVVATPGTYDIPSTVYVGSHTSLEFGNGILIRKAASAKPFMHALLNKGALTGTPDQGIAVVGLNLIVNSVNLIDFQIFGLRGQRTFFRLKDLPLFNVATQVASITISESSIRNNPVAFKGDSSAKSHTTHVSFIGCTFRHDNRMDIITCSGSRRISLKTAASNIIHESFSAGIPKGADIVTEASDLQGLCRHTQKTTETT